MDVYKLSSLVSEHDAKRAGAEIVKQSDNAPLSGRVAPPESRHYARKGGSKLDANRGFLST